MSRSRLTGTSNKGRVGIMNPSGDRSGHGAGPAMLWTKQEEMEGNFCADDDE